MAIPRRRTRSNRPPPRRIRASGHVEIDHRWHVQAPHPAPRSVLRRHRDARRRARHDGTPPTLVRARNRRAARAGESPRNFARWPVPDRVGPQPDRPAGTGEKRRTRRKMDGNDNDKSGASERSRRGGSERAPRANDSPPRTGYPGRAIRRRNVAASASRRAHAATQAAREALSRTPTRRDLIFWIAVAQLLHLVTAH